MSAATINAEATAWRIAFDVVMSAIDERPQCEVKTASGAQCTRTAKYRVTCHECSRGLACTQHVRGFLRQVDAGDQAQCQICGRVFASIADAITVVEL